MTKPPTSRIKNLTLAGISALTGCVALLVILVALFLGLWLDQRLGQRGPATILVLILSVPVSLYLMTRLALGLVRRIDITATNPEEQRSSLEKEE
jgi:hypothetical protein